MSYIALIGFLTIFQFALRIPLKRALDSKYITIGAFAYALVAVPLSVAFNHFSIASSVATWMYILLLVPLAEELIRLSAVKVSKSISVRDFVSLGFGWGMIEAILKVADIESSSGHQDLFSLQILDAVWVFAISGVVFLHVACSLVFYFYASGRCAWYVALASSLAIHAAHNLLAQTFNGNLAVSLVLFAAELILVLAAIRTLAQIDAPMSLTSDG